MGRTILIILLIAIVIFGIYSIQVNRTTSDAGTSSSSYYRNYYAKNIANSMIDILKVKLSKDTSYRIQNINEEKFLNGNVYYRVVDTTMGSTKYVKINVIAEYEGAKQSAEAYMTIEATGGGGVPIFMKYAVFSGMNMNMNGGVRITNAGNGLNANVHVNGNFSMNGNNSIDGFLTYTGYANSNPPQALNNRINPISNPDNLPKHYQTSQINIPNFDPDQYLSKATDIYYGNKTFNGNITLGTKENPKIIFVTGDLIINGSVTGYGLFISKGNTIINGNVTINGPDPNVSNVGIYSGGDLIVNGNVTLHAQTFSSKNTILNGNVKVYGNVVAKQQVNFNGNVDIYYKPANETLTKPVWGSGSSNSVVQVKMVHYYE
jgi:hypothetical protein